MRLTSFLHSAASFSALSLSVTVPARIALGHRPATVLEQLTPIHELALTARQITTQNRKADVAAGRGRQREEYGDRHKRTEFEDITNAVDTCYATRSPVENQAVDDPVVAARRC